MEDEARFTPEMFIRYYTLLRGIAVGDLGVSRVSIVCWRRGDLRGLADAVAGQPSSHWMYGERNPLYVGQVGMRPISIALLPVGAPGTVMLMEEMIACGAEVFVGLGLLGSLQPDAPIGTLVLPTRCLPEEGTSAHYLGPDADLTASARLTNLLQQSAEAEGARVLSGTVWTTDAPYRETLGKIAAYRGRGVLGVDMETSAMYALGRVRGVEVCNLLVVSDELWHVWNPAFGTPVLEEASRRARQVVLRALQQIA